MDNLVRRLLQGDDEGFREFERIFFPRLVRYFCRKGLSIDHSRDLAWNCLTDIAIFKIHKYQHQREGGFEAWVFKVAYRELINWWRSNHVYVPFGDEEIAYTPEGDFIDKVLGDPENANVTEILRAVCEAMERLTEADRKVIGLCKPIGHLTAPEVAADLGVTAGAVRVRRLRALEKLEKLLRNDPRLAGYLEKVDERRASNA